MKKLILSFGFLASLYIPITGFAEPILDLIPQSFRFNEALDDDVSMARSQHVYIAVLNRGNVAFKNSNAMRVAINRRFYNGYAYGPESSGGYQGGPILPGETGMVLISGFPLTTFSHCQKVTVQIDASRSMQYGGNVFSNDGKTFLATAIGNLRPCRIIIPPAPR